MNSPVDAAAPSFPSALGHTLPLSSRNCYAGYMEKLKQVLAEQDAVLFIGSGISLFSGLPSWLKFIEELADFLEAAGANADLVRSEAKRGDLLQAASYGFHKLTKPQIGDFVRKACRYGVAKPHEIHRKIVSLGPRCFVTTNYDNLIEESLRLWEIGSFALQSLIGISQKLLRLFMLELQILYSSHMATRQTVRVLSLRVNNIDNCCQAERGKRHWNQ